VRCYACGVSGASHRAEVNGALRRFCGACLRLLPFWERLRRDRR
jgi:hypothetical protein